MLVQIEIKVVPSSGKRLCKIDKNGIIKCFVKSPPEKGKANKEVLKVLSDVFNIPTFCFSIASGETSRKKRIKIDHDISIESLMEMLEDDRSSDKEKQCYIFPGQE